MVVSQWQRFVFTDRFERQYLKIISHVAADFHIQCTVVQ